jgi:hypothetical protein
MGYKLVRLAAALLFSLATAEAHGQPRQIGGPPQRGPQLADPMDANSPSHPPQSQDPSANRNFADPNEAGRVWKCGHCGAVLGVGPDPKLKKCPHCGYELTTPFNYYVIYCAGGAVLAGLIWLGVFLRARRSVTAERG